MIGCLTETTTCVVAKSLVLVYVFDLIEIHDKINILLGGFMPSVTLFGSHGHRFGSKFSML